MNFLHYLSVAIIPLMILLIVGNGLLRKTPIFDCFIEGAKDGISTTISILPPLVGLITAISMLRASGAFDLLADALAPVLAAIRFPPQMIPLALMRPVSGSGALAIVQDMVSTYGADSFLGRVTSVMMGSTETTFYTLAIYFGSVGIKKTRHTVKAALLADLTGILLSVYIVGLIFGWE